MKVGLQNARTATTLLLLSHFVVNIQGDQPFINPYQLDQVCNLLENGAEIATLKKRIESTSELMSKDIVKVVTDSKKRALYFSRSPIPFLRDFPEEQWLDRNTFYKHLGIYGFHRQVLLQLTTLDLSTLEDCEKLEQLRWLENGFDLTVGLTEFESIGIDTPKDLEKIRQVESF